MSTETPTPGRLPALRGWMRARGTLGAKAGDTGGWPPALHQTGPGSQGGYTHRPAVSDVFQFE